jgi:hypothetical protein
MANLCNVDLVEAKTACSINTIIDIIISVLPFAASGRRRVGAGKAGRTGRTPDFETGELCVLIAKKSCGFGILYITPVHPHCPGTPIVQPTVLG